jgi:hypothetical protein
MAVLRASFRQMDLALPCGKCGAKPSKPCHELPKNKVHVARRIKWLLATVQIRRAGKLVVR